MCFCVVLFAQFGFGATPKAQQELLDRVRSADVLHVLFVGNSYSFKIPKQFARIAKNEGKKVEIAQATHSSWTLKRHAKSEKTLANIREGKWDVVVLQEQSQIPSLPENIRKAYMTEASKKLVAEVRKAGAVPVYFLTWGRKEGDKEHAKEFPNDTYKAMQERLICGYNAVSQETGGIWIVPVGRVWSTVKATPLGDGLYGKDGSHPSALGNYLGGCVFYSSFYNEPVKKAGKKPKGAQDLAQAAAQVVVPQTELKNR